MVCMVMQASVDHYGFFTNIHVSWSRKVHNTLIFRNTPLFDSVKIGPFMKLFTRKLHSCKERFDCGLSICGMNVKCAFGTLKGKWRCLMTKLNLSKKNIPTVIAAHCALHNN